VTAVPGLRPLDPASTVCHRSHGATANHGGCAVVLEGPLGSIYNEEAFHFLLDIERKRSEQSSRYQYCLLAVDLRVLNGASERLAARVATSLFLALQVCLRETDIIGWYHYDCAVGALLTDFHRGTPADVTRQICQRVRGILCAHLPLPLAHRLQVCAFPSDRPHPDYPLSLHIDHSRENNGC